MINNIFKLSLIVITLIISVGTGMVSAEDTDSNLAFQNNAALDSHDPGNYEPP